MEVNRNRFQGIINVVRFNRHFYFMSLIIIFTLTSTVRLFPDTFQTPLFIGIGLAVIINFISLAVSFYVYDVSDLYKIKWLDKLSKATTKRLLNINAGFDETSEIILRKFPEAELTICDFFDPEKHTEVSIKRARKAYPPKPGTVNVSSTHLPFSDNSFDVAMAVLSAHKIRNENEREEFFRELNRVLSTSGRIYVTEHLRDWNNFLAYTIGVLHFHSRKSWLQSFDRADLIVVQEMKTTPFITTFILEKNGTIH